MNGFRLRGLAAARRPRSSRTDAILGRLLLLLLLGFGVLRAAPAEAQTNIVSGCPSNLEVAAGGTVTLNTFNCSDSIGSLNGLGTNYPAFVPDPNIGPPDIVNTAHGTATNYQDNDQYLVYTNNGSGTSDGYVWADANAIDHTVTISILSISTTSLPNATLGAAYSQTISVAGGTGSNSFASTTLPAGLTLNSSTGVLSGTPTTSGTYSFTVTVTDTSAPNSTSVSRTYSNFTVASSSISVSPGTLPNATVATAYSQTISASGGTSPYTYSISAGSLPAGLTLNSSTGSLSGTPTAGGSFSFTVKATDSASATGTQAYTLTVNAPTITLSPRRCMWPCHRWP
jgi:large repetitive protein